MRVPVIMYHKIDMLPRDALHHGPYTSPQRFTKQMAFLKKQGFIFYRASELMAYFSDHGSFPPRSLAITFDDGWKDTYVNAFPILRRFGINATVFLIPSCIGQVSTKATTKGEKGRAHLSREEILDMSQHGIEFGSHSLNHQLLHQIPLSDVRREVEESKRQIEALVQKPCTLFGYPAGFFTKDVQHIVKTAGYLAAFTTIYGPPDASDRYALNRMEILRRDRLFFRFARKVKPLLASLSEGTTDDLPATRWRDNT